MVPPEVVSQSADHLMASEYVYNLLNEQRSVLVAAPGKRQEHFLTNDVLRRRSEELGDYSGCRREGFKDTFVVGAENVMQGSSLSPAGSDRLIDKIEGFLNRPAETPDASKLIIIKTIMPRLLKEGGTPVVVEYLCGLLQPDLCGLTDLNGPHENVQFLAISNAPVSATVRDETKFKSLLDDPLLDLEGLNQDEIAFSYDDGAHYNVAEMPDFGDRHKLLGLFAAQMSIDYDGSLITARPKHPDVKPITRYGSPGRLEDKDQTPTGYIKVGVLSPS